MCVPVVVAVVGEEQRLLAAIMEAGEEEGSLLTREAICEEDRDNNKHSSFAFVFSLTRVSLHTKAACPHSHPQIHSTCRAFCQTHCCQTNRDSES